LFNKGSVAEHLGNDGSRLVLDGTIVTLTRPQASITTWQHPDGEWVLQEATASEVSGEQPETSIDLDEPGYPTWIAQTEPGIATTCTETVQEGSRPGD